MSMRFYHLGTHALAVLVALSLVACGSSSSSDGTKVTDTGTIDKTDTAGGTDNGVATDTTVAEDKGTTPEDTAKEDDTTTATEPSCQDYCAAVMGACTGANQQYTDLTQCIGFCAALAKIPLGTLADTAGNTVGCRQYHAGVAAKDADSAKTHCPHAGASGGGVCGTPCDLYCHESKTNCTGDAAIYKDDAECMTACGELIKKLGTPGDKAGDTLACRIYHLAVAGGGADAAKTHCPHGAADGGGVCVADACTPACEGKDCGDDGCKGSCGTCGDGKSCDASGKCVEGKQDCGTCYEGTTCDTTNGKCYGGACGDITYGGTCWADGKAVVYCGGEELVSQQCEAGCVQEGEYADCACKPDCTGKVCGGDGCGGSCGADCAEGLACDDSTGQCVTPGCGGKCGGKGVGGCWCDDYCFKNGDCCADICTACVTGETDNFTEQCKACETGCTGKECGKDCFGKECGTCTGEAVCDDTNKCCTPKCDGKTCGDDGCGGYCSCKGEQVCDDKDVCCTPKCDGTTCGDNGCGGYCYCNGSDVCGADDKCAPCVPNCEGLSCGGDGCGGECGKCDAGMGCDDKGACVKQTCEGACGDKGAGGCWCDDYCFDNGDCCTDVCTLCITGETNNFTEQCKVCEAGCGTKKCGTDCFGTSCGECKDTEYCDDAGVCQPF